MWDNRAVQITEDSAHYLYGQDSVESDFNL
jgi:hypothetical protein